MYPHTADDNDSAVYYTADRFYKNLNQYLKGEAFESICDKRKGY